MTTEKISGNALWMLYQTYRKRTEEKNHERAPSKSWDLFAYFYKQNGEKATLELAAEGEPIRDFKPISELPNELAEELYTIEELAILSNNPDQYEGDYLEDDSDEAVSYYFWQCAKDRLRDFRILAQRYDLNMSAYDYFDDDYNLKNK